MVLSGLILFACLAVPSAQAATIIDRFESSNMDLKVEELAALGDVPWGFAFVAPNQMIVTLKRGGFRLVDTDSGKVEVLNNPLEVTPSEQGGMLDVVMHPEFDKNRLLFVSHTVGPVSSTTTRLSLVEFGGGKVENVKTLITANSSSPYGVHFGSRIVAHDGFVYLTIGDLGEREKAQDLKYHNGKVLRLYFNGSIPESNPFYGDANALPEIWTYGHRNAQGLTLDLQSLRLWEMEHGPQGGDELNLLEPGKNYGWPVITYGLEYSGGNIGPTAKEGMEQPRKVYVPSIAPSGLSLYTGTRLKGWSGDLFAGALVLTHLNRLTLEGGKVVAEERLLENLNERIRNVGQGPDGRLYLSTDSGKILKIDLEGPEVPLGASHDPPRYFLGVNLICFILFCLV